MFFENKRSYFFYFADLGSKIKNRGKNFANSSRLRDQCAAVRFRKPCVGGHPERRRKKFGEDSNCHTGRPAGSTIQTRLENNAAQRHNGSYRMARKRRNTSQTGQHRARSSIAKSGQHHARSNITHGPISRSEQHYKRIKFTLGTTSQTGNNSDWSSFTIQNSNAVGSSITIGSGAAIGATLCTEQFPEPGTSQPETRSSERRFRTRILHRRRT